MKQLGNLAIVCAKRRDVLLQLLNGHVAVHIGSGPGRGMMHAAWGDDEKISKMIYELNFGKYAEDGKEDAA